MIHHTPDRCSVRTKIVDTDRLSAEAAAHIAAVLRATVEVEGRATVAFSGGSSAGPLFAALAEADLPWHALDVFQVDERVAPDGDPDRNLTLLRHYLLDRVPLSPDRLHAMPVGAVDLDAAAAGYAKVLRHHAGRIPRLDLVHLGIGTDGHTASLIPDSPLLAASSSLVGVTDRYQGRRRMTLTLPVLSRARQVLWYVSGAEKAAIVRRLADGDTSIPAGQVERARALLLLDPAAADSLPGRLSTGEH